MKKCFIVFFVFLILHPCFGQIIFEKGYFIDNNDLKTECLIKNNDWKNNPVKFEYKLNDSNIVQKADINAIKEFGIYDFSKFIRINVKIDRSSVDINELSAKRNPVWSKEQLFLKELVCGDATLFVYTDKDRSWFFFSVKNSEIQQLIFKDYIVENRINTNNTYQQQLLNTVQNENTQNIKVRQLAYTENPLVNYFRLYNKSGAYCTKTDFSKKTREIFNLKVLGSAENTKIAFPFYLTDYYNVSFDRKLFFSFGLEAEYFLPFNKNSWSVLIEPNYQYIHTSKVINEYETKLNFHTITFPIGIRYNKYINSDLKCFINGLYIPNLCITLNPELNVGKFTQLDIEQISNFALGAGVSYRSFSTELRYYSNRGLLEKYTMWETDYQRLVLILSYKLYHKTGK